MPSKKRKSASAHKQQQRSNKRRREDQRPHKAKSSEATINIVQKSRTCDICADTKLVYRNFPEIPTCKHEPNVCLDCYERHTVIRIQNNREQGWAACTCPSCNNAISQADIQSVLPRTIAKEIDRLVKESHLHGADNWLWCPSPGCGHGQLHNPSKVNKVKCSRCAAKICLRHQQLWHEGMTCLQYDIEHSEKDDNHKNMVMIRQTTKACPHCARRIEKGGGCNHMHCAGCGKYFLWDSIPFDGETTATSAEVAGGAELGNTLPPEQRELVEEVMRFENGQREHLIENQHDLPPPPLPPPAQPPQLPIPTIDQPANPDPVPGWVRQIARVQQVAMAAFTNFTPLTAGQNTQADTAPLNHAQMNAGNIRRRRQAPPEFIDLTGEDEDEDDDDDGEETIIDLTGDDD